MTLRKGQPPTLPQEARDALARAWLEVLRERHPGTVWFLVKPAADDE